MPFTEHKTAFDWKKRTIFITDCGMPWDNVDVRKRAKTMKENIPYIIEALKRDLYNFSSYFYSEIETSYNKIDKIEG